MKINQIGEDNFIQQIKAQISLSPSNVVGIGDDCAVIPFGSHYLLLTTDSLVEGVHFIKDKISPVDLGYKAVMVNLSDIAAMGGTPLYILMSIAMPKDTEESWVMDYVKGIQEACKEVNVYLIGGDTTGSKGSIFVNITAVGEVLSDNIKFRSTAKPGDIICLTDIIGDSLTGYHYMMKGESNHPAVQKHLRPKANYREGEWLGKQKAVHAMMDLSDGLVQDLTRMMVASGCKAEVNLEQIPTHIESEDAVISGEEYCLLLTVDSREFERLRNDYEKVFKRPLYSMGVVQKGSGLRFIKGNQEVQIKSKGYLHFENGNENEKTI